MRDQQGPNQNPRKPNVESQESEAEVEPWLPDSRFAPAHHELISFVRKNLLTNPSFPRIYADVMLRYYPKSRESRILRPVYQKILDRINTMTQSSTCTHIKVNGLRCGCPSLRGEQFCYFHQRMHRGVRMPAQARLHPIALIEDEESIQAALMEVINALMRNTIDLKRATLILRALHIAVKNATRVKFGLEKSNMVRDIPQYEEEDVATAASAVPASGASAAAARAATMAYAAAAEPALQAAPTEIDLPAVAASEPKPVHPDPEFWQNWEAGGVELKRQAAARRAAAAATTHVATAASPLPATPTLSNAKGTGSAAPPLPKHDFKPQPPASAERPAAGTASQPAPNREAPPTPARKTAASAPAAPQERKTAAQAVRPR